MVKNARSFTFICVQLAILPIWRSDHAADIALLGADQASSSREQREDNCQQGEQWQGSAGSGAGGLQSGPDCCHAVCLWQQLHLQGQINPCLTVLIATSRLTAAPHCLHQLVALLLQYSNMGPLSQQPSLLAASTCVDVL